LLKQHITSFGVNVTENNLKSFVGNG